MLILRKAVLCTLSRCSEIREVAKPIFSPNLFLLRSFGDEDQRRQQIFEVDAFVGSAARDEQPVGDIRRCALTQHLLHEGILVKQATVGTRRTFERFFDTTTFRVRY